ncbi:MAG: helix-turn-helix domain-containing protein [Leptospira sp.]|nr:helix-turn-helix domain-containing protein [Leptospira sp.]
MDQRKDFVLKALEKKVNFTELCKHYGISTKTGYKWKERFIKVSFAFLYEPD